MICRAKPSNDNNTNVGLHHGTKYHNLFVKFSTTLPKHAHTTSFHDITNIFGNDEVGFKFSFHFNNVKPYENFSHIQQKGYAIKYVPRKWVPRRLRYDC